MIKKHGMTATTQHGEPTVILTMSLSQARTLRNTLAPTSGDDCYALYDIVDDIVNEAERA